MHLHNSKSKLRAVTSFVSHCTGLIAISFSIGVSAHSISVEFEDTSNHVFSSDQKATITRIANDVVTEVQEILPQIPASITLSVSASESVIPETGELGIAPDPGRVNWFVDSSNSESIETIAIKHLRSTLFHELHHLARGYVVRGGRPRTSFMDVVVSEGLATAFQRDFANAKPPWAEYPEDIASWVDELLELPMSAFASYSDWMFMHPDGRRWIGYKAGTFIVDQAIAASGMSSAEMVQMSTREILELAGIE